MQRPELTDVQRERLLELWEVLKGWNIPLTGGKPKRSTGNGRSCSFGFIRKRHRLPGVGIYNAKKPIVWKALKAFADSTGFEWDSIQVNQDCVCGKHKDANNVGDSYLVSFGDYTGGELVVEGEVYDCNMKPIIFNGAKMEHWNNELTGSKWSIVLFRTTIPECFKKHFPENYRECQAYQDMKKS